MNLALLQPPTIPVQASLPTPQLVLALTLAFGVLVIVVELVRRQKLREEYAFLWMGTAGLLMVLALDMDILGWIAQVSQAESLSSILFFGAIVFLMLLSLQFSVRITKLTFQNKCLSQRIALLEQSLSDFTKTNFDDQEGTEASTKEPIVTLPANEPQASSEPAQDSASRRTEPTS
jgi:hypothetical protein